MTALTAPATTDATDLGTAMAFRRAVAAEWIRLWSVRSTPLALLAAAGMMLFIAVAFGLDSEGATPAWIAGEIAVPFAQFALLLPPMLAVTSEYATGAIRTSLQGVPRRGVLFVARATVGIGVAIVVVVLVALTADVVAGVLLGSDVVVVVGDVLRSLGTIALVVAVGGVLAVGLGLALRSSAGTLTALFLVLLVLPVMLPNSGVAWLTTVSEQLPGTAALSLLEAYGMELIGRAHAAVVLAAWTVGAVVAGGWRLFRRDAA